MTITGCHHVALRCDDAEETVRFYSDVLGMRFLVATREETYRGAPLDYLHIFFEMEDGNYLAFFEVPSLKPSVPDPNTPDWVNHIAYRVRDRATVEALKAKLEETGTSVEGPITRPPFHSIYFKDPNGHRMEITALDEVNDGRYRPDAGEAAQVLREWRDAKQKGVVKVQS